MSIAKLEQPDGTLASPVNADLPALMSDLLLLVPGLLAPLAVAGCAAAMLPSLPLTLGATAGVGTWVGLAGLGSALVKHQVPHYVLVVLAAAGAACAALAWRGMASMAAPVRRKSSDAESDSGGEAGAARHHHQQQQQHLANGHAHGHSLVLGPTGPPLPKQLAGEWTALAAGHGTVHATATGVAGSSWQGLERRSGHAGPGAYPLEHVGLDGPALSTAVDLQHRLHPLASGAKHGGSEGGRCNCKECDSPPGYAAVRGGGAAREGAVTRM